VARTRELLLSNNPSGHGLLPLGVADALEVRNLLCVPLVAKESLIGVALALNRKDARSFGEDELYLFKALADMAAVAIANARRHRDAIEHRQLEREMGVAREIQRSFLPTQFPLVPGFEFEAFTEPARHVGGDYYDIFPTVAGPVCAVLGDVSGKGPAAARYMACLHSELHLAMEFIADPAAVLARLNDIMRARSRHGAFISLALLLLEPATRRGTILSAGHPPPLLYDPATRRVDEVRCANGLPLGVMPGQQYIPTAVEIPAGGLLLGYTDGVVEARNRQGEEFGPDRLLSAVGDAAEKRWPVIPVIQERLRAFMDGASPYDDITLVCVHASAP